MLPSIALLSLLLVMLLGVDASPLRRDTKTTLSFTARMNIMGSNVTIADNDKLRIEALRGSVHKRQSVGSSSLSITDTSISYNVKVGVGNPATEYTLLIDTGSSNTWIGANTPYIPTSTSENTGGVVSVSYGSGGFSGQEYTDTLTLGPDLVVTEQSIGVSTPSDAWGFGSGVDGVLGVGPTDLTFATVSNLEFVPTVTQNLYHQGSIDTEELGIYFVPSSSDGTNGELTFGGYDASQITGPMNYVPLTGETPSLAFWGINQAINYGSTPLLSETAGIVDTGTTLILIATNAFTLYKELTGATMDETTGLLTISSDQYSNLQDLNFIINGVIYPLTPNAQIWPRSLNYLAGGSSDSIYLIVGDIGSDSGSGLDFVNGYSFLQRYYSVYDTRNHQMGFATTWHTNDETN